MQTIPQNDTLLRAVSNETNRTLYRLRIRDNITIFQRYQSLVSFHSHFLRDTLFLFFLLDDLWENFIHFYIMNIISIMAKKQLRNTWVSVRSSSSSSSSSSFLVGVTILIVSTGSGTGSRGGSSSASGAFSFRAGVPPFFNSVSQLVYFRGYKYL